MEKRPPHISPKDWKKHLDRRAGILSARAAALPGPLRAAFAADPPVVHGFTLQPVCAGLVAFLERIQSPFLAIIRLRAANGGRLTAEQVAKQVKCEPEAAIETAFCFVTPTRDLYAALADGRESFKMLAVEKIGRLHPRQLSDLQQACGLHFAASFDTVVEYEADKPEGEGGGGFPSPAARKTTGSAGGSTSSAR